MISVLKSKFKNEINHLQQNGFVVIPFVNKFDLDALNILYKEYIDTDIPFTNGVHMTTWISNIEKKIQIKNKIENILRANFEQYFYKYKLTNTTFIIKKKHKISNFPLHQDWSFVDENKYEALNIWIALQDTNQANGGLYVLQGSHNLPNKIRGVGKLNIDYYPYFDKLKPYLTSINLKAGEGILFYYSLIHGSPNNTLHKNRVVISSSILPKTAPIIINYLNEESQTIEQYKMEDDFIYFYNDIKKECTYQPNGKLIHTIPFQNTDINVEYLLKYTSTRPKNFILQKLNKLKTMLSNA